MVDRSLIALGEHFVVRWMRYRQAYPAQRYLERLGAERIKVEARLLALCLRMAEHGHLPDPAHGHWLAMPFDSIFEFKPHGHRFFAFADGSTLYLTNGAPKRKAKVQVGDYALAERLRLDYFGKRYP